nr:immunoglobulin light chain junction region [Macaca mulatta]MOY10833.1 immunoglobulin light chain junction region [Macaca mulatta]MOY11476.1 immunoglobulin light chain junction region [Macaca mulatta]MOY11842.1 immunoglobulin light chain junction region [Macaca mulatta]MOY12257.1 immunoglobulin light chain junction region [Macaca mulatta]
CYQRGSGYTF